MPFSKSSRLAGLIAALSLALVPAAAQAASGGITPGGSGSADPAGASGGDASGGDGTGTAGGTGTGTIPTVPGAKAKLVHGRAIAPASAPQEVKDAIAAANRIRNKPYIYGGGHRNFRAKGYDCSGAVSYALHGGDMLDSPLDSSSLARWGEPGPGQWISVYGAPSHAYMVIAGLRFDTSMTKGDGPSWSRSMRSTTERYRVRHPAGF